MKKTAAGFHSSFRFKIDENQCFIALVPKDFFLDPFEVKGMDLGRDIPGFSLEIIGLVDLEVAASSTMAKEHHLVVCSESPANLVIPFHVRYQAPILGRTHVSVMMPSPVIIDVARSDRGPCKMDPFLLPLISALPVSPCYSIVLEELTSLDQEFLVPVGNPSLEVFVTYSTYFISFLGVLAVLYALLFARRKKQKKD